MKDVVRLQQQLLVWFDRNRRDLPWRRTSDPYSIWVSEIMLQQTQVDKVIPFYERFLKRFPNVQALAAAPLDEVLRFWAGLGYYARARNLHRAAGVVVTQWGGVLPSNIEALLELPGFGRYTAGAVASIAFDVPAPIVDGNVIRVLSRLFRVRGNPTDAPVRTKLWDVAGDVVPHKRPGDFNQALMELGAMVCKPRTPNCGACPVSTGCLAYARGEQDAYPETVSAPTKRIVTALCAGIVRRGRVLIARRPEAGLLGGLWELPTVESSSVKNHRRELKAGVKRSVGLSVDVGDHVTKVGHEFSHISMTYELYACDATGRARAVDGYSAVRWVAAEALPEYGVGAATKRLLRKLL